MDPREKRDDETMAEWGARLAAMGVAPATPFVPFQAVDNTPYSNPEALAATGTVLGGLTALEAAKRAAELKGLISPKHGSVFGPKTFEKMTGKPGAGIFSKAGPLAAGLTIPAQIASGLPMLAYSEDVQTPMTTGDEVPLTNAQMHALAGTSPVTGILPPSVLAAQAPSLAGTQTGMDVAMDAGGAVGGYPTVDYSQMAQDWGDPTIMSAPTDPTGGLIDIDALAGRFSAGPTSTTQVGGPATATRQGAGWVDPDSQKFGTDQLSDAPVLSYDYISRDLGLEPVGGYVDGMGFPQHTGLRYPGQGKTAFELSLEPTDYSKSWPEIIGYAPFTEAVTGPRKDVMPSLVAAADDPHPLSLEAYKKDVPWHGESRVKAGVRTGVGSKDFSNWMGEQQRKANETEVSPTFKPSDFDDIFTNQVPDPFATMAVKQAMVDDSFIGRMFADEEAAQNVDTFKGVPAVVPQPTQRPPARTIRAFTPRVVSAVPAPPAPVAAPVQPAGPSAADIERQNQAVINARFAQEAAARQQQQRYLAALDDESARRMMNMSQAQVAREVAREVEAAVAAGPAAMYGGSLGDPVGREAVIEARGGRGGGYGGGHPDR